MAKKDKKKPEKQKGLLGRIFGGGKDEKVPETPEGGDMDAQTIAPDLAMTIPPDRDDVGEALTIPPTDYRAPKKGGGQPLDDAGEARTLAPFTAPKDVLGKKGFFEDPVDQQRTLGPFEMPDDLKKEAKGAKKGGAPASPAGAGGDLFDDAGEARTLAPFDRPRAAPAPVKKQPSTPAASFSPDSVTLPPTPASELDIDGPTLMPQHFKASPPPAPPKKVGRGREDDALTQDPLLTPAPKDLGNKDPFAFDDDIMGAAGSAPPPPPPQAKGGAKPRAAADDDLGFGDDVHDLLAPTGKTPSNDPFGSPLADDPFASDLSPPVPGKTDEIDSFEVELGSGAHPALTAAPPPPPAKKKTSPTAKRAALQADGDHEEKTIEMDRPPVQVPGAPAPQPAPAPPRRTLFASREPLPDGSIRFGKPADEVKLDQESRTLHAPAITPSWGDVPDFAVLLSDGSVVGRLPAGVQHELDGSFVVPAAPPRREPAATADGMRVPPFPAGVIVDRAAGFAYASKDVAPLLAGSPEAVLALEDGSAVVTLPRDAKWNEDGSYVVPATEKAAEPGVAPVGTASLHHGDLVLELRYMGCVETVFEDGWASLELPKTAKVEGELVLLPASSRLEPGAPPELLEIESRPDGLLALRLPAGYVPEGDVAWLPPAEIAPCEEHVEVENSWGEPQEEIDYLGIHESLYANGWTRLDLPPGARVAGRKLVLPREYAHAGNAWALAQFDRDTDGSLLFELPADAESLGGTVLIPPDGGAPEVRPVALAKTPTGRVSRAPVAPAPAAPAPVAPAPVAPAPVAEEPVVAPAPVEETPIRRSSESALPPSGGGIAPRTKGLDRFRVKKSLETGDASSEQPAEPDKVAAEPAKAEETKPADEKPAETPAAVAVAEKPPEAAAVTPETPPVVESSSESDEAPVDAPSSETSGKRRRKKSSS